MQVSEIVGVKDGSYELQDIFGFQQMGVDADGVAKGEFFATGYKPQCLSQLQAAGINLPDELFAKRRFSTAVS
jgi:pilus assembly protein CpaF